MMVRVFFKKILLINLLFIGVCVSQKDDTEDNHITFYINYFLNPSIDINVPGDSENLITFLYSEQCVGVTKKCGNIFFTENTQKIFDQKMNNIYEKILKQRDCQKTKDLVRVLEFAISCYTFSSKKDSFQKCYELLCQIYPNDLCLKINFIYVFKDYDLQKASKMFTSILKIMKNNDYQYGNLPFFDQNFVTYFEYFFKKNLLENIEHLEKIELHDKSTQVSYIKNLIDNELVEPQKAYEILKKIDWKQLGLSHVKCDVCVLSCFIDVLTKMNRAEEASPYAISLYEKWTEEKKIPRDPKKYFSDLLFFSLPGNDTFLRYSGHMLLIFSFLNGKEHLKMFDELYQFMLKNLKKLKYQGCHLWCPFKKRRIVEALKRRDPAKLVMFYKKYKTSKDCCSNTNKNIFFDFIELIIKKENTVKYEDFKIILDDISFIFDMIQSNAFNDLDCTQKEVVIKVLNYIASFVKNKKKSTQISNFVKTLENQHSNASAKNFNEHSFFCTFMDEVYFFKSKKSIEEADKEIDALFSSIMNKGNRKSDKKR